MSKYLAYSRTDAGHKSSQRFFISAVGAVDRVRPLARDTELRLYYLTVVTPPFLPASLLIVLVLRVVASPTLVDACSSLAVSASPRFFQRRNRALGCRVRFSVSRAAFSTLLLAFATPFGLTAVALTAFALQLIVDPLQLVFLIWGICALVGETLEPLLGFADASGALVALGYSTAFILPDTPPFAEIALVSSAGFAAYFVAIAILDRVKLTEIVALVRRGS